jgi:uncharacterized membrane protein YoaT (DUF817 family)
MPLAFLLLLSGTLYIGKFLREVTTLNHEIFDHSVELTAIITLWQTFFSFPRRQKSQPMPLVFLLLLISVFLFHVQPSKWHIVHWQLPATKQTKGSIEITHRTCQYSSKAYHRTEGMQAGTTLRAPHHPADVIL